MKLKQTHMMYGLLTGLAAIILGLILHLLKMSMESWAQYVSYALIFAGLILNANNYAKANNGYVTYSNVYGSCFKASLFIALLMMIWMVASTYIFPEIKEQVLAKMAEEYERKGMPEEQAQTAMEMTDKYWMMGAIFGGFGGTLVLGAILSLIAAAIPKKKGALPEHMQQ